MLIAGIVSLMDSIPLSVSTIYSYSRFALGVSPRGDEQAMQDFRVRFDQKLPIELERRIDCRVSTASIKSIVGDWPFAVFGMAQEDMEYYVRKLGGESIEGSYPADAQPEALISRPVATNLGLKVGDTLLGPDKPDSFSPFNVTVVGIVETDQWMMLIPIAYHREFQFPPIDAHMYFAKSPTAQRDLDSWALKEFKGASVRLYSYENLKKETDQSFRTLYTILNVVVGSLVVVITVMMGMLMNIYQSQRIQEFGLLQAIGHSKKTILRRLLGETAYVLLGSWMLGVFVALALLLFVKTQLFDPRAYALDPWAVRAYLYSIPVPLMIFVVSALDVVIRLKKFDPVGVVERRLV